MNRSVRRIALLGLTLAVVFGLGSAQAQEAEYTISITNLTRGQIFSPPVAVVHSPSIALFTPGEPAIEPLRLLAEDGMPTPLIDALSASEQVYGLAAAGGPVLPGETVTVTVGARGGRSVISVVGMLVTTNDAFFAVDSAYAPNFRVPGLQSAGLLGTVYASAWDAGSEANSELCSEIPGPPCGSAGVRNTEGAEGYVHVHAGISGAGDLDPAVWDWNNPVAKVVITRTR